MSGNAIGSYGLLSDCSSAALVGLDGSINWLCMTRFDRPSVFARLLDPEGGHCSLAPTVGYGTRRRYLPGTLVLETRHSTNDGVVQVLDALAFNEGQRGHELGLDVPHELLRLVRGLDGSVPMRFEVFPRPEYGLGRRYLLPTDRGARSLGGPLRFEVGSGVPLELESAGAVAEFEVRPGEEVGFSMQWAIVEFPQPDPTPPDRIGSRIQDTVKGWRSWEADHDVYRGPRREVIKLSSRVLKGLTYRPTGAIVAAPTTSLPETVGGERNWDYRFAWIRDASLTLEALWVGTCSDEVENFVTWMLGAAGGHVHGDRHLQIMYGIGGEIDLTEREMPHLAGWRDSRPVRIGNGAWSQTQLDIYGEFLNAFYLYAERLGAPDRFVGHFISDLADAAARHWEGPDAGMWEMRAEPRHHLSSKVMCWVALDRAVKLASSIQAGDKVEHWTKERDRIRQTILTRGYSESKGAFTQAFGSDELDASVLVMPLVGFIEANDPRMRSTIEAIDEELAQDGMVLRYRSRDGLSGDEGTFVICSFWMVSCLAMAGEVERAEALFERVTGHANDLGLLAEEIDPHSGELLGNFPQAFSHVGLIMAAYHLDRAAEGAGVGSVTGAEG